MLLGILIAADLAGTLAVSDRTEFRARIPGTPPSLVSLDTDTVLDTKLTLATHRWLYTFEYAPGLTLWDINDAERELTLMHNGHIRAEWVHRFVRLSVDELASYGGVDFAAMPLLPGTVGVAPPVLVVPGTQVIQAMESTTTLRSLLTLPRWTLDMSVGYELGGGANPSSVALLPDQAGPFAAVLGEYNVTRTEHALLKVSAAEESYSSGPESLLAEADLGWKHLWSPITQTRLSVGVSEARERLSETAPYTLTTYPVCEALFERTAPADGHEHYVSLQIGARLGPVVNPLIGLVDERIEGTVVAGHSYRRVTTHAFVSASESVPTESITATSLLAAEVGVAYDLTRLIAIDSGVRSLWERQEATGASFSQTTLFVGLTVRAPPVHF